MSDYSKLGWFAAGTLLGTWGLKLLVSEDAKKAYVHATAAGLRAKEEVMKTVTSVQETAADILAEAEDLNEERAAKAAEKLEESQIEEAEAEDFVEVTEDESEEEA